MKRKKIGLRELLRVDETTPAVVIREIEKFEPPKRTPEQKMDDAISSVMSTHAHCDHSVYDAMMFIEDCKEFTKDQKLALMKLVGILLGGEGYVRPVPPYIGARNTRFDEADAEVRNKSAKDGIKFDEKSGYVITKKTKKTELQRLLPTPPQRRTFTPKRAKLGKNREAPIKTCMDYE
jgi:hypothetical protein